MTKNAKAAMRTLINERRRKLLPDEVLNRSSVIMGKLEVLIDFLRAKRVLIYWSMPEEVQTHDFILKWSDIKEFVLPQVNGDELVLRKFTGVKALKKGRNIPIMEPTGEEILDYTSIDFAIVPGVAFDRNGNRLGRGKAYYDNLLPKLSHILKVGVAFDFQVQKVVPTDESDVQVDMVISD